MTTRVTLVAPAMSWEVRAVVFGADGPLDEAGRKAAGEAATPAADRACSGPALRCRETAAALGFAAEVADELADWNVGAWRGRTLDAVTAERPADVEAWLTDPDAAPHGGESLRELLGRVGRWLDGLPSGRTVAVTDPAVVRAAVVHGLGLPAETFWRIDVAPLTATALTGREGRWNLRVGAALAGPRA